MLVLPNSSSAISERYTSPLKLFEYLTLGRPIVASDLPAIREVLTHERTALLVPPDDPAGAGPRARAAGLGRAAGGVAGTGGARPRVAYTWSQRARRLEAALEAARPS